MPTDNTPVLDPKLQADIDAAKMACKLRQEALARRKAMPDTEMNEEEHDPADALLKVACPDAYSDDPKVEPKLHVFIGDRTKHDEYISRGYMPVVVDGKHVKDRGDPCYTLPMELHKDHMNRRASKAFANLQAGYKDEESQGVGKTSQEGSITIESTGKKNK